MSRLTDKKYWESVYDSSLRAQVISDTSVLKKYIKRIFGPKLMDWLSAYDDYLLWRSVFTSYLPKSDRPLLAVEIGSAPGHFMTRFARTFGANCFGVEYTQNGSEVNRMNFAAEGIDPANVIEADFFSDEFINTNKQKFDVVISRGFIEHFDDVEDVLLRHNALLRPGGVLFVLIPNLKGIYGFWTRMFNPAQLPLHNLSIMNLSCYEQLFCKLPLKKIRCGYFGTFSFWLFTAPQKAVVLKRVIHILLIFQRGLNVVMRVLFRKKGCESSLFSPNLIYVGKKESSD